METRLRPRQFTSLRDKLKFDVIDGVPVSPGNAVRDPEAHDPSGMSKLNLVVPGFPVGNGFGPEISKFAANQPTHPAVPPLSKGLASIYDADIYKTQGRLALKAPYKTPYYVGPWTGNSPTVPFTNTSFFDVGKSLRRFFDNAHVPDWIASSRLSQAGAGAAIGSAAGLGMGYLNRLQGADESPASSGTIGAVIGALLGALRKPR